MIRPATFAPLTVRVWSRPNRINGSSCRRSHATKPARSASAAANRATVEPARESALAPCGEGRRRAGARARRDDPRPEALERAPSDQRPLGPRQPREQGGEREDDEAREEDPPAPEQVGRAPAEEQEAAEGE